MRDARLVRASSGAAAPRACGPSLEARRGASPCPGATSETGRPRDRPSSSNRRSCAPADGRGPRSRPQARQMRQGGGVLRELRRRAEQRQAAGASLRGRFRATLSRPSRGLLRVASPERHRGSPSTTTGPAAAIDWLSTAGPSAETVSGTPTAGSCWDAARAHDRGSAADRERPLTVHRGGGASSGAWAAECRRPTWSARCRAKARSPANARRGLLRDASRDLLRGARLEWRALRGSSGEAGRLIGWYRDGRSRSRSAGGRRRSARRDMGYGDTVAA